MYEHVVCVGVCVLVLFDVLCVCVCGLLCVYVL